jgi:hypothetical protein
VIIILIICSGCLVRYGCVFTWWCYCVMVVCLVYVIIEYNLLFARLVFCYDGRMSVKHRIICDRVPLLMWGGYITHFIIIAPLLFDTQRDHGLSWSRWWKGGLLCVVMRGFVPSKRLRRELWTPSSLSSCVGREGIFPWHGTTFRVRTRGIGHGKIISKQNSGCSFFHCFVNPFGGY